MNEPTKGRNILDLVLCNEPFLVGTVKVGPPFSVADHCMVEFNISLLDSSRSTSASSASSFKHDFSRANWELIYQYMHDVNWESVFSECYTCDGLVSGFYNVLDRCMY